MRFLRAAFALATLLGLLLVPSTAQAEAAKTETRISWSAPTQDRLWAGDRVDISGLVEWREPTGWHPLGNARYVTISCDLQTTSVQTEPDGTFHTSFTPGKMCGLYVDFSPEDSAFKAAYSDHHGVVHQHTAFTGLNWPKSPVVQGIPFRLKGTYLRTPGNLPVDRPSFAELFFSADRKDWQSVGPYADANAKGFITTTAAAWGNGYWKLVVSARSLEYEQITLISPLIKVRKHAHFVGVNATPEPVRKGHKLSVHGGLTNPYDGDGVRGRVTIWFRAKGSKAWKKLAVVGTDRYGAFNKAFKASRDGSWRASFAGDAVYFGATSGSDYVDVR